MALIRSRKRCELRLNKLKKSPKNARKTPHGEASIEAYAASIAAKGILQNLVVEPELDRDGLATGFYFVTIGEGRRLAQLLRVKRKEIKKTEPSRPRARRVPAGCCSRAKGHRGLLCRSRVDGRAGTADAVSAPS